MPLFEDRGNAWSSTYIRGLLNVRPTWPVLLLLAPQYDEVYCYFLEDGFEGAKLSLEGWSNLNYTSGFLCSSAITSPLNPVKLEDQDIAFCFCHSGLLAAFGVRDHVNLLDTIGRCGSPEDNRTWLSRWIEQCAYVLEAGHDGQFLLCYSRIEMDESYKSELRSAVNKQFS